MLFDETKEGVVVPFVASTLHQEAFSSSPAVASKDPLADYPPSTVVLAFAELRFIDLHYVSSSSDLPRGTTV